MLEQDLTTVPVADIQDVSIWGTVLRGQILAQEKERVQKLSFLASIFLGKEYNKYIMYDNLTNLYR